MFIAHAHKQLITITWPFDHFAAILQSRDERKDWCGECESAEEFCAPLPGESPDSKLLRARFLQGLVGKVGVV